MSRSIKRNFIYNVGYQLLQIAIPIVTTPYVSRVLGAERIGVYSFTNAVVGYFVLVAALGMSTYGVRAIASVRDDPEECSRQFWGAFAAQAGVAVVVLMAYFGFMATVGRAEAIYYLLWLPMVAKSLIDVSWFLFGLEDFGFTTARSLFFRVLGVFCIFGFVRSPQDLDIYILITGGTALLSNISIWPRALSHISFVRPTVEEIRRHFLASLGLFVPVIATSLYNSLDKVMLGVISGTTEVGFYEYAGRMCSITASVMGAMGTVMLPRVSSYIGTGRTDEAKELVGTALWLMLAMAFAFSFGLASVAPTFVPVFFGDEFLPCTVLMSVLAVTIPLLSVSNVLGRQWLLPNKRDVLYTRSVFAGAVVDIALNVFLMPSMGALGASLSTIAAEAAVCLAQVRYVHGELPIWRFLVSSAPFCVFGIVMFVSVRAFDRVATQLWGTTALTLLTDIAVGALVYGAIALAYCIITKNERFLRVFGARVVSQ